QKTSEYEAYVSGESSSGQNNEQEQDDDEIPTKQVSQDIMEETTPLVLSCQRDPEAPALSLINQDLLYLKKGNSGPEKIMLSFYKFPAVVFIDDDIEECTSRWVNKCVKKFNPYTRYGVEHWKNPHAKIFYIRKQKEPRKPKEMIYSNLKIIQVIKTYWELGHVLADHEWEVPDYAETGLLWSLSVFIRRIKEFKMFSIIYEPMHGIIYKNSKKEKRVMRYSEIHK
nr:hypothetical protein [Tanacetum cinerariifolium]